MTPARCLIANADDFGLSPGINRGVARAHEQGIVTSASLMVRGPAATAAAAYARTRPALSVGLHIDLGEWIYRSDEWVPLYTVVPADDPAAVAAEVARQLAAFRTLVGADPTHLDSHQHVHLDPPAHGMLLAVGADLGVPVRSCTSGVRYCGDFYGQTAEGAPFPEGVGVANLLAMLAALPPGITELGCHPGEGEPLATTYRAERASEVRTLCDPQVRAAVEAYGIRLISYHDVLRAGRGPS